MKLNETVRTDMRNAVLCWLATVDAEGQPNVSPKEIFAAYGDEALVIADIASPVSVANILVSPRVTVAFLDIFRQRGFKIAGSARIVRAGDADFAGLAADLLAMAGPDFLIRNVIQVSVDRVSRILAPSYRVFPDRSEEDHIRRTQAAYGVRPA